MSRASNNPREKRKMDSYIPVGRRIFDIHYLFEQIKNLGRHDPFDCPISDMSVVGETRKGFLSKFRLRCKMCAKEINLYSEDPEIIKLDINSAMVTSNVCTGQGFTQMAEVCAAINMPCMSSTTYQAMHRKISSKMRDVALEQMSLAGEEEAKLALEAGEVDRDGIPVITVVADGSWAKRS
ncbi:hypothetical protein J437_LFUL013622 [Ladona fulva]|uniref:Mutator-like transposase domain-containing protein n=1 Tax=Ladona fulva TaxID=123851 RepID=A0A8K0KNP6_LADFU|nr:hypothetical protein J437_LFUL013622 [Ladona fulva]